jgi:hypothetical protein
MKHLFAVVVLSLAVVAPASADVRKPRFPWLFSAVSSVRPILHRHMAPPIPADGAARIKPTFPKLSLPAPPWKPNRRY